MPLEFPVRATQPGNPHHLLFPESPPFGTHPHRSHPHTLMYQNPIQPSHTQVWYQWNVTRSLLKTHYGIPKSNLHGGSTFKNPYEVAKLKKDFHRP